MIISDTSSSYSSIITYNKYHNILLRLRENIVVESTILGAAVDVGNNDILNDIQKNHDEEKQGSSSSSSSSSSEKQMLIDFPYYRLLQSWRKKVIECLIHRTLQEKHIENITRKIKKERKEMLITINKYETDSLILKQKYIIYDEKYKLLTQTNHDNYAKLMNVTQEKKDVMKKLQEYTTSFENIFLYLKNLQLFINKKILIMI